MAQIILSEDFVRLVANNRYSNESIALHVRAEVEKLCRYDYVNQAWIEDGKYVRCGHKGDSCQCYGRLHEGEAANG